MKINLSPEIVDKDGVVVKAKAPKTESVLNDDGVEVEVQGMQEKVVTLGVMLAQALIRNDGDREEGSVKRRYELFKRFYNKEDVEVSDEELVYLKKLVCEAFEIFFAGQILEILDNQAK